MKPHVTAWIFISFVGNMSYAQAGDQSELNKAIDYLNSTQCNGIAMTISPKLQAETQTFSYNSNGTIFKVKCKCVDGKWKCGNEDM